MKKYILLFAMSLFLFASCEEDLTIYEEGDGFVQLATTSSVSFEEGDSAVSTSVILGASENPSGVTVTFTVTSSDPSRYTVEPASGTLEIPAGEFSADIVITPIENILVDGDVELVIELTSGSSRAIGIGGEGLQSTSRTVVLVDNDCPVDTNQFIGTYSVDEVFTAGGNEGLTLSGAFGESYQIEMVAQPGDASGTRLVITNSAGFNTYITDGTVLILQTCPGTVTFDPLPLTPALFANLTIETAVYDEEASTITVNGPLGNFGPYQFILTRQ